MPHIYSLGQIPYPNTNVYSMHYFWCHLEWHTLLWSARIIESWTIGWRSQKLVLFFVVGSFEEGTSLAGILCNLHPGGMLLGFIVHTPPGVARDGCCSIKTLWLRSSAMANFSLTCNNIINHACPCSSDCDSNLCILCGRSILLAPSWKQLSIESTKRAGITKNSH